MLVSLPVQRRIMRAELWALLQAPSLSEPGASFISDCAAVLRGIARGEKWCTAGRRPHADVWREIWQRFRYIGKEAQVDSVLKCKAHLTKAEWAKLNDEGRLATAGNEWADRLAKDGAGDDSFQATMCGWYKTAARTCTDIITYIGNFMLRAKTGDRWPDVTSPPQEWQEKDERWKRVKPTLARPHLLVRYGKQWSCDSCGRHASDGPSKSKLARTECVGHPAVQLCLVLQMWSKSSQVREESERTVHGASEVAGVCTEHTLAVEWLAPQGESFPWIAEAFYCTNVVQVAIGTPGSPFGQSWEERA